MGGIRRRRLVALLLGVWMLAAGCGGGDRQDGAQAPAPTTTAPTTTAAADAVPVDKGCLEADEQAKAFRFRAGGGDTVGLALGSGRDGIVLGHQSGSDLCEWLPQARSFAGQGYRVLLFDFPPGSTITRDVVAATAELRRRGASEVVLVGSSMGGAAVLAAAPRISPPVAGVVSLSAPHEYLDADAQAAAGRLRVPVLFVAAEDDRPFADDARAMYRAASVGDKRLLILPSGGHGTSLLEFGDQAAKVRSAVTGFLRAHLGG
jgi:pimeloyl-ACP methyl ester carboxylesterase